MNYLSLSLGLLLVVGWVSAEEYQTQEQEQKVTLAESIVQERHKAGTDFNFDDFDPNEFEIEYHDPSRAEVIINYLLSMAASVPGVLELALAIKQYWQGKEAEETMGSQEEPVVNNSTPEEIYIAAEAEDMQLEEQVHQEL